MLGRLRLLLLLLLLFPFNAGAVLIVFEYTCNNDAPFDDGISGNCSLFGLSDTGTVSGSFTQNYALYAPGPGAGLDNDEYDLLFEFGNQAFTEQDNRLSLTFIVGSSGTTLSSMAGVFVNAAGAQLNLLTSSTVMIFLGSDGADTVVKVPAGW